MSIGRDRIAQAKDQWIEESSLALAKILHAHFSTSEDSLAYKQVPHLCMTQLCRAGWPGVYLSQPLRAEVLAELEAITGALYYSHEQKALALFSKKAARAIIDRVPTTVYRNLGQSNQSAASNYQLKKLSAIVQAEFMASQNSDVAVQRAALRLFQEERRHRRRSMIIDNTSTDPLHAVLSLPRTQTTELPKQDLRAHILKSSTADLLRQAAPFSAQQLKQALGEELYARARPVGYADRSGKVLLVEIESSALAHELSFRKNEIIARLSRVKGFENVSDIRFKYRAQG